MPEQGRGQTNYKIPIKIWANSHQPRKYRIETGTPKTVLRNYLIVMNELGGFALLFFGNLILLYIRRAVSGPGFHSCLNLLI